MRRWLSLTYEFVGLSLIVSGFAVWSATTLDHARLLLDLGIVLTGAPPSIAWLRQRLHRH
jgi:hypothetical protein